MYIVYNCNKDAQIFYNEIKTNLPGTVEELSERKKQRYFSAGTSYPDTQGLKISKKYLEAILCWKKLHISIW